MEAFATYLIKSSVWLTGFALVYALFLRNERFFTLNRIYLVTGILVSLIFPFFTWHYTIVLPLVPSIEVSDPQVQGIAIPEESFNPQNLLLLAYLAGIFYLIFRIMRQTLPVFRIIRKSEKRLYSSAKLIRTDAYPASFSFFSFVFVNPSIDETETNEIVNHELEHIRQQHWIDLLLFEILRTMQWFNPICWLYGHLIRQNHEYLADERALQRSSNPAIYRAALLNQMFGGPVISLANSFNYSLNKKRFNMMKQTISSPLRKLKLLLVLPLIAGVFYAFAAPEYKFTQAENTNVVPEGKTVIGKVISDDGKPLKGANIVVVEGGIGTVTDSNGNFKLEVPDDLPLAISYVGFETQKVLPDFGKEMVITMKSKTFSIKLDSPNSADPKKVQVDLNQTNALIIVDGKEITKVEMEKIKPETIESISVLKGESAAKLYGEKGKDGVVLITLKNDGQTPQILKVQSNSPLKFGNPDGSVSQPMIVKDGLVVKNQDVNNIPPETIESINVLKGEKAISKYGQKGSSGVVEIWTKKDNAKDVKPASEPIPFTITGNSSNSTDQANSVIEGFGKKPLVVIDGVISEIQSPDKVPSDSIASISILKGETATSKYGEKGKNGVMEITTKKSDEVGVIVESLPEFPGGIEALKKFVAESMEYPADALKNGIQGQVVVGFVVGKTGEITNVRIKTSVDTSLDQEAMRIVKSMPRWIPGKQNGQGVDVFYKIPITFSLPAKK